MIQKTKFIATPSNLQGGHIIERWNESKQLYERFAPVDGALSEKNAKDLAALMNTLSEE